MRIFLLFLLTLVTATPAIPCRDQTCTAHNALPIHDTLPDPLCARGKARKGVCCHPLCKKCGGRGCGRPRGLKPFCCLRRIRKIGRSCANVGPPCVLTIKGNDGKNAHTSTPSASPRPSLSKSPSSSPSKSVAISVSSTPSVSSSSTPSMTSSASPSPSASVQNVPKADPDCTTGVQAGAICCPGECSQCGGQGCYARPPGGGVCCSGGVTRSCLSNVPPCRIEAPSPAPRAGGIWRTMDVKGKPSKRHEACFVVVDGKGYLIGGRGMKPVDVYDPKLGEWSSRDGPGVMLHHMQCVAWGGKVWIVSAWTGHYPREENVDRIYVYDVHKNEWSTRDGLPEYRLRGGAASVLLDDKIYVVGGNRGGHGAHAEALGWMDAYDLKKDKWILELPEMGDKRDHVGGGVVAGMICIASGRDSGTAGFFKAVKVSTWCFKDGKWENMEADLEEGRAGSAVGTICDGRLMVAGGEGPRGAYSRVDLFDGKTWVRTDDLKEGRHGSGLGVSACECGAVFIASGSGGLGGGPELESLELWTLNESELDCDVY